jgi:isoleucyl-tRNA synthetase
MKEVHGIRAPNIEGHGSLRFVNDRVALKSTPVESPGHGAFRGPAAGSPRGGEAAPRFPGGTGGTKELFMPFEKVESGVDFPALERRTLAFWERSAIFDKLRRKNAGNPPWSFLDGPITANNPMGVHHAWGRTYKDVFQRYFAMNGRELRYQNGFDCQGLWVEVEVEKELGLSTKRDIESFGLDRFTEACKARVRKYAAIQTEQSKRLGYWMDWNDSYYTMSEENNYTIWSFLKKCHQFGHLYKGTDVMPWSGRAGSAYSHMEIAEGRRLITHTAVFVRFALRGRPNEFLLVWTTTPWTLTSNTGCAVNSELSYIRLRAKRDGATYYLAEANLKHERLAREYKEGFGTSSWPKNVPKLRPIHQIFQEQGGYTIEGTVRGADMIGWTYDGPFDELPAQQRRGGFAQPADLIPADERDWPSGRDGHRVFDPGRDSKGNVYVLAGEGTGVVHSAPGCGDVDHVWGRKQQLVAIAPLNEDGAFIEGFGKFTGKRAIDPATVELILADLKEKGLLVASEPYPHVYPHCWRTGDELVFRLVDEWFISMDWRDEIKATARQVNWLPPAMRGLERELDWLTTMKDWMISKKRFWGLALPIWECPRCRHFEVIGGRGELKELAVSGWKEFEGHSPHRPYVDAIRIRCAKCGESGVPRVPDVGNPWLDAGIVAYSTTRYNTDPDYWEKWIPADLITECFPGQFRNWFYSILAMSTMMELGKPNRRPPFRNLLGHALVLDENRRAMHKSDGTAIWFEEAAEQLGVDTMRWMYCAQSPTVDLPFGLRHPGEAVSIRTAEGETLTKTVDGADLCRVSSTPADEVRRRVLLTLWNTYAFFCNYARLDEFDPSAPMVPMSERQDIDRWVLSDLQLVIREGRERFEKFELAPVCQAVERFVDDLSTWYVRRNRRRFWRGRSEGDGDKLAAYQTLYEVLTTLTRLLAPMIPFVAEEMYQNLVGRKVAGSAESVHLCEFPVVDERKIDPGLSDRMRLVLRTVSLARFIRTSTKMKIRQPLASMVVASRNPVARSAVEQLRAHVLEELNVKELTVRETADDLFTVQVKGNMAQLGPKYGKQAGAVAKALASVEGRVAAAAAGGPLTVTVDGTPVTLTPDEIIITRTFAEGWAAAEELDALVLLDTRLTPELKAEGLARDIVRNVQNLRKDAGLEMQDRIRLGVLTESPDVRGAVDAFADYIRRETLANEIAYDRAGPADAATDVAIEGYSVSLSIRRCEVLQES